MPPYTLELEQNHSANYDSVKLTDSKHVPCFVKLSHQLLSPTFMGVSFKNLLSSTSHLFSEEHDQHELSNLIKFYLLTM